MIDGVSIAKKPLGCRNCTIMLVRLAYRRAPWFRVIREPLWYGIRIMAAWHRVDLAEYELPTPSCYDCMRYYKVALRDRSASYRWLHERINPVFNSLLERFVTQAERKEAGAYARAAMAGDVATAPDINKKA